MELEFRAGDEDLYGELRSLYEWLRRADDLRRSSLRLVHEPVRAGAMGADIGHLLLELWPLEAAVLGSVVKTWLRTRGVDVDAERTAQGGVRVSIRRARKGDTHALGEQLFDLLRDADGSAGAGAAGHAGGEPKGD